MRSPASRKDLSQGRTSAQNIGFHFGEGDAQSFRNIFVRHVFEVVKNERLVFTDAYVKAWEPSEKPFMTGTITFEDDGNDKTKNTARVQHWSTAHRETHEKMGFHQGWGQCADQLNALVSKG